MSDPQQIDCPHATRCGGCALIAQPLPVQLLAKQQRVQRAFARYPSLDLTAEQTTPARPVVGYRTRAKWMVSATGALGLYAAQSHDVVDLPECRVLSGSLSAIAVRLRARLREVGGAGGLSAVDLREVHTDGDQGVLVTLLGTAGEDLAAWVREVGSWPTVRGVAVGERELHAPQLLGRNLRVVSGPSAIRDDLGDTGPWTFAAHGSFVQAHRGQAAAVYGRVIEGLAQTLGTLEGARVLELYAGAGALGLRLAARGARVTMVEAYAPAATLAAEAARAQDLHIEVQSMDAVDALRGPLRATAAFDAVVVNPPRRGLEPAVRAAIAAIEPRVLAYVACEPETLARDLDHLGWSGLRTQHVTPYDMIPLSADVESVAIVLPGAPSAPRLLYADEEVLIVDKPPHVPTTPQGEYATSLLALVRTAYDAPEATPVHRLDLGTSGACIFARAPRFVARWAAVLAEGRKRYVALVRGIPRPKGIVRRPLREQGRSRPLDATTRYRRLEVVSGHGFVGVEPEQGRTHQIRRHLAALGHPVLGDARYGDARSNLHFERKHGLDRTFLHCARLTLPLVVDQPPLVVDAALAPDLDAVLHSVRTPRFER